MKEKKKKAKKGIDNNEAVDNKDVVEKVEENSPKKPSSVPASERYKYLIKNRQVRQHTRRRKIVVVLLIFLGITILLGGGTFGVISFLQYNNFKVLVDKQGMNILTLSNKREFSNRSEILSLEGPRFMDNVTLMDIYRNIPEIKATEGNFGKRDTMKYMASTFFLKNISDSDQVYSETIIIDDITKNVDEAIRIMVIREDEMTVYAKKSASGEPEEVVPGQFFTKEGVPGAEEDIWFSTPFQSPKHAFYNSGIALASGEVKRYTIIVWLEGEDPECTDPILGGTIRMELQFTQQ